MKAHENKLKVPGYDFAAIECGIRYQGRLDYSLVYSHKPCNASGVFTTNKLFAAPVKLCRERINNKVNAILINATNANACTGKEGYENAVAITSALCKTLKIQESAVLMASTGVIGVQLPAQKMADSLPALVKELNADKGDLLTRAIMTTDTVPKSLSVSFATSRGEFTIGGTIKGAGMIDPNMATMLCFIMTDCPVDKINLDNIFIRCVNRTLNSLTIDGDMSTNDTAIILTPDEKSIAGDDLAEFEKALYYVLNRLGEMIIMDGEGATKMVKIEIAGAASHDDAVKAAKAVSKSLLVKTAMFGQDPNWGRVACAAGYSGAALKEETLSVYFDDIALLVNGTPQAYDKAAIKKILAKRSYTIKVDLGLGKNEAAYLTTDISYDYVKINAEYTT